MYCPNCGAPADSDSLFCGACGTPLARSQQSVPQKKKGKKKSILPVIISLILVVALAGTGVLFLVFNREKTVYLPEKHTYTEGSIHYEFEYEYDENSLLTKYTYLYQVYDWYDDGSPYESFTKYEYEYDDNGRLAAAEKDTDSSNANLEYIYNKDGILDEISWTSDQGEWKFKISPDGLIKKITIGNSTVTYGYDADGNLEEKLFAIGDRRISHIYENGIRTEYCSYDVNLGVDFKYEYDKYGNLILEEQAQDSGTDYCTVEYTYDEDGRVLSFEISEETASGEKHQITGEVAWDGREYAEVTFDGDDMEWNSLSENISMELEYDEYGNLLRCEWFEDGESIREECYSYVERKVPKDYKEIKDYDPLWFPG